LEHSHRSMRSGSSIQAHEHHGPPTDRIDPSAATSRLTNGKPDLSGVWMTGEPACVIRDGARQRAQFAGETIDEICIEGERFSKQRSVDHGGAL
jgi:hypothetical protein